MKRTFALASLCSLTTLYALLTPFLILFTNIVWVLSSEKEGLAQWYSLIGAYILPAMLIPFTSLAWFYYGRDRYRPSLLAISIPGLILAGFYAVALFIS